jgi:hypothetical protein
LLATIEEPTAAKLGKHVARITTRETFDQQLTAWRIGD